MWVKLQNELKDSVKDYLGIALPPVPLVEQHLQFTVDIGRASRFIADLKAHPSVLESQADRSALTAMDAVVDYYRNSGKTVVVPAILFAGCAGSGKTTATKKYLQGLSSDQRRLARVVSHTESLRAKAKRTLDFPEMRGYNFPTLSSIIVEPTAGSVVFDDAGKMWGGLLDLVVLANPLLTEVVINGDPLQGLSNFPVRGTQSEYDPTAIASVAVGGTSYATETYRMFALVRNTLGLHGTNPDNGHITHTIHPKTNIPVCTASPRYVGVLQGAGREAYTYESVQGEDFNTDVEVDMTGLEGAVLDRSAYVALTRSSRGIYLQMNAADPNSVIKKPPTGSDIMNALVYAMRAGGKPHLTAPCAIVKACFYKHMHNCMPNLPWFAPVGASVPVSAYQSVLPVAEFTPVVEGAPLETSLGEAEPCSSGPLDHPVLETHSIAKELREVSVRGQQTDQFKETAFVNPHVHKRGDNATYRLSLEKRITPASPEENLQRHQANPRRDMCDEFDRLVPNPPKWDAAKHAQYTDEAIRDYESKRTEVAVLAKLHKHDPLRTGSDIDLSLKGQVIRKDEKREKLEAIPGQLIHEYDISVTLGDAPYVAFLEQELFPAFPEQFLFYRKMNPGEFIAAYKKRWRVLNGVNASDVTRWDVGCDAALLNFDIHVMERCGFPRDYVEAYRERRLSSRSRHGPMATMQNSGDRYTWCLNSIRRAIVTSLVCQLTPADTAAINGDDAAVDRQLTPLPFPDSPWEFKNHNGLYGEFSGFELGGPEPTYSARGLFYRALILESRDPSAQDKWTNYLDLLQWAPRDSPEALSVVQMAKKYLRPDLLLKFLPAHFRPILFTM
jgi:hypothetical protein